MYYNIIILRAVDGKRFPEIGVQDSPRRSCAHYIADRFFVISHRNSDYKLHVWRPRNGLLYTYYKRKYILYARKALWFLYNVYTPACVYV